MANRDGFIKRELKRLIQYYIKPRIAIIYGKLQGELLIRLCVLPKELQNLPQS